MIIHIKIPDENFYEFLKTACKFVKKKISVLYSDVFKIFIF